LQNIAALAHGDGQADSRLAVVAKQWLDRVYIAPVYLGDVGKPEELIADAEIDGFEALFGNELPADTD
jgi:O-succinylbenzoate synthase